MLWLFCFCVLGSSFAQTPPTQIDAAPGKQAVPEFKTVVPDTLLLARDGRAVVQGNVLFKPLMRFEDMKLRFGSDQCFTMHGYQFSKGDDPKQVGESTCTDAKLVRLLPVDKDKIVRYEKDQPQK
jgi:hypothetical protein